MEHYFIAHTIFQLIFAIPLIYVLIKWKKTPVILKLLVVLTFLYSLPFYWDTLFHKPIGYDIDLSQNLTGKEYSFEIYPGKRNYVIGFQITTTNICGCGCLAKDSDSGWPKDGINDAEIVLQNVIYPKLIINREYVRFNCLGSLENSQFLYGRIVEFQNLFKKTKVIYKIKTQPTRQIGSIVLTMDLLGYDDKGIGFSFGLIFYVIIIYGTILLYILCKFLAGKLKRKHTKR